MLKDPMIEHPHTGEMLDDPVLEITFDNPWGTGSFARRNFASLVSEVDEIYGVTATQENVESLARQWCGLKGYGFLKVKIA